ncbi:SDR family NAD(P)-dependent oxidoreductase [Flavobacterium rhizosphaerae]|uniref:SDR family NAD(P)-dependent oxidoreductase n=1 Tax=Flavobacterium rhizosphaerae TaxID=3163298 RepID=A0ABW8YXU9_9FLAO
MLQEVAVVWAGDMVINLAKKGNNIIFTYHSNKVEADKVVTEVLSLGQKAIAYQLDVSNIKNFDAFLDQVSGHLTQHEGSPNFDFLINNAGAGIYGSVSETTEEAFDAMMNVHFMILDDPAGTYTYLIEELNKLDFAYVELMRRSPYFPSPAHYPKDDEIEFFGRKIRQTIIANAGYDKDSTEAELDKGIAKLISFGTLFIANPDLPQRFEKNAALNEPDKATMFSGAEHGYIDYPLLND